MRPSKNVAVIDGLKDVEHWLHRPDRCAVAVSLVIHLGLFGSLLFCAFSKSTGTPESTFVWQRVPISAELPEFDAVLHPIEPADAPSPEFEAAGTMSASASAEWLAAAGSARETSPVAPGGSSPVLLDSPLEIDRPRDLLQGIGSGFGEGIGNGAGPGRSTGNLTDGYSLPGGGQVVTKGSFSAWTVPADPRPRQAYLVVIQVEWPKTKDRRTLQARRFDLSGTIVGTDTYFQSIEQTGYFVPKANQMVVPVPGGERNVRDVIRVQSKMLDESQELAIRF
jgi:hypothetical protein